MEAEASGHTLMHPEDRLLATAAALDSITLEDVAVVARELCEHISHMDVTRGILPAAMVVCAPENDRTGAPFTVTDDDVAAVVEEALLQPVEPPVDTIVPDTLLTNKQLLEKARITPPSFAPLRGKAAVESANANKNTVKKENVYTDSKIGVVQRQLSNGIKVNMKYLSDEPQRVSMRMYIPGIILQQLHGVSISCSFSLLCLSLNLCLHTTGGRMLESRAHPGAVLLGARAIQEGGAFLDLTREEVELFCIDHLVMVEITATEEAIVFDFQSVTTPGTGRADREHQVTGIEAVMQVAHIILTDFKYEPDAFERAKQSFHEQFDSTVKGLESACTESLTYSLTGADNR